MTERREKNDAQKEHEEKVFGKEDDLINLLLSQLK